MFYLIIFLLALFLDRITKYFAVLYCAQEYKILPFFSCQLTINRGISWSIGHSSNNLVFYLLTSVIIIITILLAIYSYYNYKQNKLIFGEVLVLAGSVSNILDRFIYSGVIDFISIYFNNYYFPVFNIADAVIFIGIVFMFFSLSK